MARRHRQDERPTTRRVIAADPKTWVRRPTSCSKGGTSMSIGKLARVAVGVIAILGVIGLSAATAQPVAAATYDNVNPDGNACQNTAIVARHKDILDNQNKIAGY